MSPELEQKLAQEFALMRPRTDTNQAGCIYDLYAAFGCDFGGDGWYEIMRGLCKELQEACNKEPGAKVIPMQIKEKFGSLQFYFHAENCSEELNDELYNIVNKWEGISERTCMECGAAAVMRNNGGWVSPLCEEHYAERRR